jgi:hypothetical protein
MRSEYDECVALKEYLDILVRQNKIIHYTHVPNETFTRDWGTKMKNKRLGVQKGFPDYVILLCDGMLFIEMKRVKRSTISYEQQEWIRLLDGYVDCYAKVCHGFNEAEEFIKEHL